MPTKIEEIITDKELDAVYANANFGSMTKRDVVRLGLLKCAAGFYQGRTSTAIISQLGLIDGEYALTPKGRMYLWAAFSDESNF